MIAEDIRDCNEFLVKQGKRMLDVKNAIKRSKESRRNESEPQQSHQGKNDHDGPESKAQPDVVEENEFQIFTSNGILDTSDFLPKLASLYLRKGLLELNSNTIWLPSTLNLGSLCAGSGTGEMTFAAAVACVSDFFLQPISAEVVFCCERESWKQTHLLKHIVDSGTCVFDDVTTLGAAIDKPVPEQAVIIDRPKTKVNTAKDLADASHFCIRHKKPCMPPTDIFLVKSGFSCKGNSKMNLKFGAFRDSMKNRDFTNSSVSTFFGTLGVLSLTKPKAFILENVDAIGNEASDSNLSRVMDELK